MADHLTNPDVQPSPLGSYRWQGVRNVSENADNVLGFYLHDVHAPLPEPERYKGGRVLITIEVLNG